MPLFIIIAALILVVSGSPVVYKHKRIGINAVKFEFYKFRTMVAGKSHSSEHDEIRITSIGKFLRKTSLDELPSLFNVLKGDMSFVGPRPLLVKYKDRFSSIQNRRHEVRPGISGLAQIKGRNALSWDKKFEYDIYYVDHFNLLMDLKILFITLFQVLRGQGVSPSEQGIMPEFMEKDNVDKTSNIS
jgi:lipopolysaccharide/colanic/teichoic acid biosynthesis glycosyltransferase|tara:strand:+ start:1926 stop:2486 length:561 start_codon:yes stop_codon:yes gene_type:complete